MIQGLFVALDVATLQTLQAQYIACATNIATGQQSYSIAGRTFTRADLTSVKDMLAEIAYALRLNSGGLQRTVYSDLSNS